METGDQHSSSRSSRAITLQLSSGALVVAAMIIGMIVALAVVIAFLAGMTLQQQAAPALIQPVTVVTIASDPVAAAPAPAAYPAPAAQNPVPVAEPANNPPVVVPTVLEVQAAAPVFQPIRPTAVQARGFAAPDGSMPTLPPADFALAPAGAQAAPTVAAGVVIAAPAQVAVVPSAVPPTAEPVVPTQAPARDAQSGGDSGASVPVQAPPRSVAHQIKGNVTWTADKGPIVLKGDLEIQRGASLVLGEGVEMQIPRGATLTVHGNLYVLGSAARPVRITQIGTDTSQRWEAIYARPGSAVVFNNVEISGGGAGGTLLGGEVSDIRIRGSKIIRNGGQIRLVDSRVELRDNEIRDNDLPYGSAVEVIFSRGGTVTLVNNRMFANNLTSGSAPVLISNQSFQYPTTLEITGNLLTGKDGPNLQLFTNAQMQGNITCNTLLGGANGVSLRSDAPPNLAPMINLRDNAIEGHTPPIIEIYLEYGIGRGATSDLPLGMANNWWESELGPYEPDRNNIGRGEAVGDTVAFSPWLLQRPACAPR